MPLDAPILIVWGDQDVIRETSPVLAERFPAATKVCVEQAGHFTWLDQPEAFSETLLRFYRTDPSRC
jgi:pimeloyl-ACP methyl ester carboxylesterase